MKPTLDAKGVLLVVAILGLCLLQGTAYLWGRLLP